ncbi:MAG: zinc transporter ZupT [Clostridiales bacterium]|nr:zinc transporter ZupT [Clostridiales bacterium]
MDLNALIMSTAAGLSTMLGALFVFFCKGKNEKILCISMGFAAGIMLSVSFIDLFQNATILLSSQLGDKLGISLSVIFLGLGIFAASLLDMFVPHQEYNDETGEKTHNNLFKVGFVSMLAIALHNFPEGIATFMAAYQDTKMGIAITFAIALHNIPEGISVAMPIYYSTQNKGKALKYTFLSGITEPLGALLAFLILKPFINDAILGGIFALVAGIMVYVSVEELLPSSRQYGYNNHALIATFVGICIMPLTHII